MYIVCMLPKPGPKSLSMIFMVIINKVTIERYGKCIQTASLLNLFHTFKPVLLQMILGQTLLNW
jgi:hypothetical protein